MPENNKIIENVPLNDDVQVCTPDTVEQVQKNPKFWEGQENYEVFEYDNENKKDVDT